MSTHWTKYTTQQLQFLREGYREMSIRDLTSAFNSQFGTSRSEGQIRATTRNHRFKSGRTGQFEKGNTSWNLGKKGYIGANRTSFKKGNTPANRKPLGAERIDVKDGFVMVKIAERNPYTGSPTRYKHKQVHVWETTYGPIPKGHVVAFKDGNKLNCDPTNLMLVTRAELLVLNSHKYKDQPEELKPSVLALAKLEAKAGIRTRPSRGCKRAAEATA